MPTESRWPKYWVGRWTAPDGKTVAIEGTHGAYTVSVAPTWDMATYESAELLGGGTTRIERLVAQCFIDEDGRRYLEIEAGSPGLGPTYRLYAAVDDEAGLRLAADDVAVRDIVLMPNTSIGLYDDYEDDLGVPWAHPLEPMRWVGH